MVSTGRGTARSCADPQRDVLRIERDSTVGSVKVNLECLKKVLNKGCALQPLIAPPVEVAHVLGGHIADLYGEAARSMTARAAPG
eukprot:jgi/Botrbrau1/7462/Bobra.0095s0001.1